MVPSRASHQARRSRAGFSATSATIVSIAATVVGTLAGLTGYQIAHTPAPPLLVIIVRLPAGTLMLR